MNLENDKTQSPIRSNKVYLNKTNNNSRKYIDIDNDNDKKYFKRIQKKYNNNSKIIKPDSQNVLYCTNVDSSLNFSTNNQNSSNQVLINTDVINNKNNTTSNNNKGINGKNRIQENLPSLEEINHKFHSLKFDRSRRERSVAGYKTKNTYNYINNNTFNIKDKKIKRAVSFSYSKPINNKTNNLCNNINLNGKVIKFKYNNIYNKINTIKNNNNLFKKAKKIDYFKIKIKSIMNNCRKELLQHKIPRVNTYKNLRNSKYFYNYNNNQTKPRNFNFLSNKENDINTFNVFARSKLMDINDIKNINNKNFFDYNYNRNYISKCNINKGNITFKNNDLLYKLKNNKNYEELLDSILN